MYAMLVCLHYCFARTLVYTDSNHDSNLVALDYCIYLVGFISNGKHVGDGFGTREMSH